MSRRFRVSSNYTSKYHDRSAEIEDLKERSRRLYCRWITDRCFPELQEVLESGAVRSPDTDEYTEAADEMIRAAVEHERTRVSGKSGPDAETLAGRDLQQITGAPSALVNRLVQNAANEMLESSDDDQGKPN